METILNVGIVAHVDAGKTTITERLLYQTGAIRSFGEVDSGKTTTDWLDFEKERGISVKSSCASFRCGSVRVNLIDTPGHIDFAGEVERALSVLDAAILLVSAGEGIQAQTQLLWQALRSLNLPVLIVINKVDNMGSDTAHALSQIKRFFSPNCIAVTGCEKEGGKDCAVLPLLPTNAKAVEDITAAVADLDDDIADLFLDSKPIPYQKLYASFCALTKTGALFPVIHTSALTGKGMEELPTYIADFLPSAPVVEESAPPAGVIYKVEHDPVMGKVCHLRLYQGSLKNRDTVTIGEELMKVTQIRRVFGGKSSDIGQIYAGDIGAVCGLTGAKTGDIIGSVPFYNKYHLAAALFTIKVTPLAPEQLTALVAAFTELADEDPLLELEWLKAERELHIKITGMMQLEVLAALLKERYNLQAQFSAPTVIYKETPSASGFGFDAYTMPKPCWAVVKFYIEPTPRGSGLTYCSEASNNDCLYRYQEHIKTAVPRALKQGMHGWEVTDLAVTLTYAQSHHVHTHPLDFFLATPMGIMDGLRRTGTTLLEPILQVQIRAEEGILGKVIGDIIDMRGSFDSPVIQRGSFELEARLPVATSLEYPIRLGALSGGKAVYSARFAGYEPCLLELGSEQPYRGVNPLDRAKWILYARGAIQ